MHKMLKTIKIPIEKGGNARENTMFQTPLYDSIPFYKQITRWLFIKYDDKRHE